MKPDSAPRRHILILGLLLLLPAFAPGNNAMPRAAAQASPPGAPASPGASMPEPGAYFAPTGHYLGGIFLRYWQETGGLAVFGYPLTPAFRESGFTVQYFERARFELHPENAGSSYEVLLGQLGKERLKSEGRQVPRPDTTVPPAPGEMLFPETGYRVSGPFLDFWRERGGLPIFGYPLSPQMKDVPSGLTVQYFERARFELHPENAGSEHEVLLTLLGVERAARLDPLLRAPWPAAIPASNLRLVSGGGKVQVLDTLTVSSDVAGEVRVLGGDNRPYTSRPVSAGVPLSLVVAGAAGEGSVVLLQGGLPVAALWGVFQSTAPAWGVRSADPTWTDLYARVERYLSYDAVDYLAPDEVTPVHGYRSPDNIAIWLRDHVHQSKGFKYFDPQMTSALDYFRSTQRADGSYDDYLFNTIATDVHKDQIEVEADREYLFVEGVWTAWQATGDDRWLWDNLRAMERGMAHLWGDPRRWSPEHNLIKRAFTIDTWDFEQGSTEKFVRRRIDEHTKWGIMHGDNTGAVNAARLLAAMQRYLGRRAEADLWEERAAALQENLNRLAWNGRFYTHQVHLTPVDPTGVDEKEQLSLSNAYALNRGTLSQQQAASIIRTYQERRARYGAERFAEWYSIDPAFTYGFSTPGDYVNGGIMPLVGGELAKGAFAHGFESYGVDILRRYHALIEKDNGTFLWYHYSGAPGYGTQHTINTDGWGSSAMLSALLEGLAGVVDGGKLYDQVLLAPRWAVECAGACAGREYSAALRYPASNAYFAYRLKFRADGGTDLAWGGRETASIRLHLLLPGNLAPKQLLVHGAPFPFTLSRIEGSLYLDATLPGSGSALLK